MNTTIHTTLTNIENKLNTLITSLTTSPTASGAPTAAVSLLQADDSLTSAVETLRQHQANYAKILRLRSEARDLEERVRGVVRTVVGCEGDIVRTCDSGSDESCSESESESEFGSESEDEELSGVAKATGNKKGMKQVEYKLLLDFARRISKYNHAAAAAALEKGQEMDVGEDGAEPVACVTEDATSWLDESAKLTRQAYMLPYPMEDRIRLGLMGQIQLAAAEGADYDPEREVERLIREAEGGGVADALPSAPVVEESRVDEAAVAAVNAGSVAVGVGRPKPKPKPDLDLDLDLDDDF
ncbi:vitamin-D-receptor interacting mediator subunit 4-domain-containing protein [Aspergillus avenaceus]|uniref:Mediator of RNA polymerase II transcription subunit 4 n=1 Tax=Aspergillus avenaceus TaxID=36643 RepID=A0A5N6U2U4_ASPAV|nr:vitamin-D-receptor interacting mediator subunit 4-domain-containing protein [Aspergillus avenaceus]